MVKLLLSSQQQDFFLADKSDTEQLFVTNCVFLDKFVLLQIDVK